MPPLTVQQAFDLAVQQHRAGRLAEAENLCRQILAHDPAHFGALHLLGVIAHQAGRDDIAVDLIRRALVLDPNSAQAHSNLGNALRDLGQLDEAVASQRRAIALSPDFPEGFNNLGNALKIARRFDEAIAAYRQAIAQRPGYSEAQNNMGNALKESGRLDEAISAYQEAIVFNPSLPEAHNNLGNALKDKAQLDEAISAYRRAIALRPAYAEAHSNLGNALKDKGQLDEAVAACRQAIGLRPGYAEAHMNLGNALKEKGRLDEAIEAFRRAVALRPGYAEAHANLGNALKERGLIEEAIAACRQAIALNPNLPEAHNNLGNALRARGRIEEAVTAFAQAIVLRPDYAEAHGNLGNTLKEKGELDEAIAALRQAVALRPDLPEAHSNLGNALKDKGELDAAIAAYHRAIDLNVSLPEARNNLGNALKDQGEFDEALAEYRQAVALRPGYCGAHSNLVYTMLFHPDVDARSIAEELRAWNRQHAEPLRTPGLVYPNDRTPDRRLRIGYVSPDFRNHVVGRNLLPLFRQHDHRQFEITCYAEVPIPDAVTVEFQKHADRWRDIVGLTDEQVAEQIRLDEIDILVDLTLHMAQNRLLVFARKPAPVQATFAGYPGSTGLSAIDYRLSDPFLDPTGMDESIYSERTIRLPDAFWCYDPLDCAEIPVNSLPVLSGGVVTFGCLNNFCKVNDKVLALWAKVLRQVEGSRLVLLAQIGSHRSHMLERIAREGIDPERIEFVANQPRKQYMKTYRRIDLGLDTFPYNGHTTSLDSFWMGVPVVTLVGDRAVARAGWCQLSNLGLTELAAQTPDEFVRIAVDLANDLPRLEQLRSTLRRRMEQSPLMDAPKFARNIEAVYRRMWQTWCETATAGPAAV